MKILVIEDDPRMADYLIKGLKEENYVVDHAPDGRDGLLRAAGNEYDLLIVDRMLPGLDGLGVISTLRAAGNRVPSLILSALGEVDERIRGLRTGGDDYLTKPFAFGELLARIEALLRRGHLRPQETVLRVADLEMDLVARKVTRAGREIGLQPQEWRLLEYMMRNAGRVLSRTMIFESVWDYHFDPQTNVIDVHIGRLRRKIDRGVERPLIQTVRGTGYALEAPE
jgi:two-component system OmpR family response regulator